MTDLKSHQLTDAGETDRDLPSVRQSGEQCKVFVSYSREDASEFAKELADWLEVNALAVWLDREIIAGDEYDTTIERAIRECAVFVVIITTAAVRPGSFVRREIQYAHDAGKLIVPVRLSQLDGPILLKTRQWLTADEALGQKMLECLTRPTPVRIESTHRRRVVNVYRVRLIALFALGIVASGLAWRAMWPQNQEQDAPPTTPSGERTDNQLRAAIADHEEILKTRAAVIGKYLATIGEEKASLEFLSLHEQNIKALSEGKITLSHELTTQIQDFLGPYRCKMHTVYYPSNDPDWQPPWTPAFDEALSDAYCRLEPRPQTPTAPADRTPTGRPTLRAPMNTIPAAK